MPTLKPDTSAPVVHPNGPDPELVHAAIHELEKFDKELESEKGAYMARCAKIKDRRKVAFEDYRAKGLAKNDMNDAIEIRRNMHKIDKIKAARADADERTQLDMFMDALKRGEAAHAEREENGENLTSETSDDGKPWPDDQDIGKKKAGAKQPDWQTVGQALEGGPAA